MYPLVPLTDTEIRIHICCVLMRPQMFAHTHGELITMIDTILTLYDTKVCNAIWTESITHLFRREAMRIQTAVELADIAATGQSTLPFVAKQVREFLIKHEVIVDETSLLRLSSLQKKSKS